jgi:hypothetical protein
MGDERIDERIKVDVERSGGFGGLVLRRTLDTADLTSDEAARLRVLLDEADLDAVDPAARSLPVPDAFRYRLTVVRGGQRWELSLGDPQVPARLRPLLRHVLAAAGPPPPHE